MPTQESSQVRSAQSARSYAGQGKPGAADRCSEEPAALVSQWALNPPNPLHLVIVGVVGIASLSRRPSDR